MSCNRYAVPACPVNKSYNGSAKCNWGLAFTFANVWQKAEP